MNNCLFCGSSDLDKARDFYIPFYWHKCLNCYCWHIDPKPTNYGHLWKFVQMKDKTYILEENDGSVIVYESLINYPHEDSQPDMLITYPEKLIVKNSNIKKVISKFNYYMNFL